ncbi:MAG: MJ1477/TM1410 family putative glycoside hydrolase [Candidatus Heimdallarchaeaceae archaeon]
MKKIYVILVLVVCLATILGSTLYFFLRPNFTPIVQQPSFFINGQEVNDFGYQLQDVDIEEVGSSKYDLMIIDYSSDGSEEGEYTTSDLHLMKEPEDKLLLSYMSIGEAETYRFYWEDSWDSNGDGVPDPSAPEWLDVENPEWGENYKVKYWYQDWQNIIFGLNESYLDRIINSGFDGCYLDIIDAYEYYQDTYPNAEQDMMDFVGNLSLYAKSLNSDFLVFVQNSEQLLENSIYFDSVDGIGREDVYYFDNSENDIEEINEIIPYLELMTSAGKPVLIVDYPTRKSKIYDVYERSMNDGFLSYVGPRDLHKLRYYGFAMPD